MREQIWGQLDEEQARDAIRHYWAYCTYEDELLGRVLDELDASGQAEDTLVVLLSDHGDYAGAHGLFLKGAPAFREAYHVPALVRWPAGIVDPGRRVDELVSLADFAPTFTELAGVGPARDATISGRSLVGFFRNEKPDGWREALLTQLNGVELYYSQRSVITKDWKFVYNGFDFDELYDRRGDPWEVHNLAADQAHAAVADELVELMWTLAESEEDWRIFNRYATVALARRGPLGAKRQLQGHGV
jgi:arylsulfatase A-like enzyme